MKNRKTKLFFTAILTIIAALSINGCYYVSYGQFKSAGKLAEGKELSPYECFSLYTLHTAFWMFGWPAAPAAADEMFHMQIAGSRTDTLIHRNPLIKKGLLSERVVSTMRSLSPGQSKRLAWNGDMSYALTDKEDRAALALNPCTISRETDSRDGKDYFVIRLDESWPKWSETHITLWGDKEFIVQEGLFRYIQDKGYLHRFIGEYRYPVQSILTPRPKFAVAHKVLIIKK